MYTWVPIARRGGWILGQLGFDTVESTSLSTIYAIMADVVEELMALRVEYEQVVENQAPWLPEQEQQGYAPQEDRSPSSSTLSESSAR